MIIADSPGLLSKYHHDICSFSAADLSHIKKPGLDAPDIEVIKALFPGKTLHIANASDREFPNHEFYLESSESSRFDLMVKLSRKLNINSSIAVFTGKAKGFHGFRERPWEAESGNLHMTLHINPQRHIPAFGAQFLMLAAVAACEAVNSFEGLRKKSRIKWVNDILIGNSKIGGVIAHSQSMGTKTGSVVLGIGINVNSSPNVERDSWVPAVSSIKDNIDYDDGQLLSRLKSALLENLGYCYGLIISGKADKLYRAYLSNSAAIGREVMITSDPREGTPSTIAEGILEKIGPELELYLRGIDKPLRSGRMIFKNPN